VRRSNQCFAALHNLLYSPLFPFAANEPQALITIKKYPNRRLYDTSQSQYVNLDYIRQLIVNHDDFEVIDSKSGADLTKSILLQIISEEETSEQQSLLTTQLLKQLIRFYGSDMQLFVRQYLEQSLANFLDQQDTVQGMMKQLVNTGPLGMLSKMVEQNMNAWQQFAPKTEQEKEE
jgi:polyhydroxyalkanoate synthesis repressor PhaR